MQVDVAEDRRYRAALRAAAERFPVFPVFQVPGPEHVAHEPEEPLVMDFLRQYPEKDFLVETAEAVGDVALDEPDGPGPGFAYLPQCGVTAFSFPEPVRPV